MSIASVTSSLSSLLPVTPDTGAPQTTGNDKRKTGADVGAAAGQSSASASTITNTTTQTNADGTITVLTTYGDGTTTSTIEANPNPVSSQGLLSKSNGGQLGTLLSAQEQARPVGSQGQDADGAANSAAIKPLIAGPASPRLGTLLSTQG